MLPSLTCVWTDITFCSPYHKIDSEYIHTNISLLNKNTYKYSTYIFEIHSFCQLEDPKIISIALKSIWDLKIDKIVFQTGVISR